MRSLTFPEKKILEKSLFFKNIGDVFEAAKAVVFFPPMQWGVISVKPPEKNVENYQRIKANQS